MSRSFFSRANTTREQTESLLLPQNSGHDSVPLSPISQRSSSSVSQNRSTSPSPPPSFYRATNNPSSQSQPRSSSAPRNFFQSPRLPDDFDKTQARAARNGSAPNPRPRGTRIQFSAPPPPIASSVFWSPSHSSTQLSPPHRPSSVSSYGSPSRASGNTSSTILRVRRGSSGVDPLLGIERKEKAIQAELQVLLDAQAAGLLLGFGQGGDKDGGGSEDGSSTPTMSVSVSGAGRGGKGGVTPVRQPKKRVVGLRGARRGLGHDMGELIGVKGEEVSVLKGEIGRREDVLERIAAWEERIEGVEKKLAAADDIRGDGGEDGEGEGREISDLQKEERALEGEIREMEDRIAQMRARKKWLGDRVREKKNRREARLSSYRGALREAEGEVQEFLRRPPVEVSVVMGPEEGVGWMELPVGRRTLGMARDWWTREVNKLRERKEDVEKEQAALQQGREMWEDVIKVVGEFEDGLRKEMGLGSGQQSTASLKAQIGKMRIAIEILETHFSEAEKRGWNLLICAVAAELEAFKEGEGVLNRVLEMVAGAEEEREDSFHSTDDGLNALAELNGAVKRTESESTESEDDGPNLEVLLVDRGREEID